MNPFKNLKKHEWFLWICSLVTVFLSNIISGEFVWSTLLGTVVGVTALIFVAKGDVWGQILTVIFSILYAITSYKFRYWGEMITYLGMSMPIAGLSVITWIKNPFEKGKNVVKISKLTRKQTIFMFALTLAVTLVFHYILKLFNTPNLFFSTISITTSFLASYLMMKRISYYAIAYAANDIVLIILWIMASIKDFSYFPMIICFVLFFVNDIYGFISWKIREKGQNTNKR